MSKFPIVTVREHHNPEDPDEVTKVVEFDLGKMRDWFRYASWLFNNMDILPISGIWPKEK